MSMNRPSVSPADTTSSEKTSYKRILGHSSIYIVGMMISKAIGFVMIPIYTNFLTPSDYGTLELLSMTTDVVAILAGVGIARAVLRLYYEYDTRPEQNMVVSTALISGLVAFVAVFGLLMLRSDFVSRVVFGTDESAYYFDIIFLTMMLLSAVEIPLVYLRAQQRSLYFVLINLVKLIIQLSLNIYFIVFLEWGVLGVLYSSLISSILIGGFLTIRTFTDTGFHFSLERFKGLLGYGYPLIFSNLGAFVLTYSDRYFLRYFTDLTEVGIYSLGYKFGMMVTILLMAPFHQFWTAEMFAVAKREDGPKTFRDMFMYSTMVSIVFCFALSLYIREIIEFIAVESYWPAYHVVPLICLAYVLVGMHGFTSCGILISKKTKLLAYSTLFAVTANVALNFLLIPRWGAFGAAYATIASFFIRFYTTYRYSQRHFYIRYEWLRIITALALAVALVVLSNMVEFGSVYAALGFKSAVLISYPILLYLLGWVKPHEKELILRYLRHPMSILGTRNTSRK